MLAGGGVQKGNRVVLSEPLRVLTPEQVSEIDRALAAIGSFGEVRLVKIKGRVRFIQQLESRDLLRVHRPGGNR